MGRIAVGGPPVKGGTGPSRTDFKDLKQQILSRLDVAGEFHALGVRFSKDHENASGWRECYAVDRDESKPSAGVNVQNGYYFDQVGDDKGINLFDFAVKRGEHTDFNSALQHYKQKAGLAGQGGAKAKKVRTLGPVVKEYSYHDADGGLVMQVTRHDPKDFRQRRPDGFDIDGNIVWKWNLVGVKVVPYRLPRILESKDSGATVYVCEGEKDCDLLNSLGLIATTIPMGAKKNNQYIAVLCEPLRGRHVVVIADNDEVGGIHAEAVCAALQGFAASVTLISAADFRGVDLPPKGDVSDYFALGGSLESLVELATLAPGWVPVQPLKVVRPDDSSDGSKAGKIVPIEADDDPHRMANVFIKQEFTDQNGNVTLVSHRDDFFRYADTHYELYRDLRTDLVAVIKEDADKRNVEKIEKIIDQLVAAGTKDIDPDKLPKVMKVTPSRVTAAELALQSETSVSANVDPPCWIDGGFNLPHAVNIMSAANGLVDLESREILPHTPKFFSPFSALSYAYDPSAPAPKRWLRFIHEELWPDDPESARQLQKWFGYLLTPDTRHHVILLLLGPRRSGKGTIARIIEALLGSHNIDAPNLSSLATPFGLMSLLGKTAAIIKDARFHGSTSDMAVVIERLLNISGEDEITIDRKYKEPLKVKLRSRLMIISNEEPNFRESSTALASRFIPLLLKESYFGKEDVGLTDALLGELAGILNWAIEGRDMLAEDGRFNIPASSKSLMEDIEEMSSPAHHFGETCCRMLGPDDQAEVEDKDLPPCSDFYEAWCIWCQRTGHHSGSDSVFYRNFRSAFSKILITRPRSSDGVRKRRYRGVALNEVGESYRLCFPTKPMTKSDWRVD